MPGLKTTTAESLLSAMRRFTLASYANNRTISAGALSRAEWHLMWLLKTWPDPKGAQPSKLAQRLRVTAGNVTQQLRRLEHQVLIKRTHDDVDRRVVLIKLTPAGEQMLSKVRGEFIAHFETLIIKLGQQDSEMFTSLLLSAAEHLETEGPSG